MLAVGCVVLGPFGFAGGLSSLCTLIDDAGAGCLGRAIVEMRVRDGVGRMGVYWERGLLLLSGRVGLRGWRVHVGSILGS